MEDLESDATQNVDDSDYFDNSYGHDSTTEPEFVGFFGKQQQHSLNEIDENHVFYVNSVYQLSAVNKILKSYIEDDHNVALSNNYDKQKNLSQDPNCKMISFSHASSMGAMGLSLLYISTPHHCFVLDMEVTGDIATVNNNVQLTGGVHSFRYLVDLAGQRRHYRKNYLNSNGIANITAVEAAATEEFERSLQQNSSTTRLNESNSEDSTKSISNILSDINPYFHQMSSALNNYKLSSSDSSENHNEVQSDDSRLQQKFTTVTDSGTQSLITNKLYSNEQYTLVNSPPSLSSLVKRFDLEDKIPQIDIHRLASLRQWSNWSYRPLSYDQVMLPAKDCHRMIRIEQELRQECDCYPHRNWTL